MDEVNAYLVFTLADLRCALMVTTVERVLRAVRVSPVPNAPDTIMGMINVQGRVIPVLNIRKILHLPDCEIDLNNQVIIVQTEGRFVAIVVDTVLGVDEYTPQDVMKTVDHYSEFKHIKGVVKLRNEIIYIYDFGRFVSSEISDALSSLQTSAIGE